MKTLVKLVAGLAIATMVAVPVAEAKSKSYCSYQAKRTANFQAAGKTVVGAGLGCLLGQLISKKCGVGAAIGGIGGFAIGSAKWKRVYNDAYWNCRHS